MTQNTTDSKYCVTCKYLLGNRSYVDNYRGWRCCAPANISDKRNNLVSGEVEDVYFKELCIEARRYESACGVEGKWYELYIPPVQQHSPTQQHATTGKRAGKFGIEDL